MVIFRLFIIGLCLFGAWYANAHAAQLDHADVYMYVFVGIVAVNLWQLIRSKSHT